MQKETRLFGCLTLVLILMMGGVWGWFSFTAMPVVNIPSPTLPKPNAFDTHLQAVSAKVSAPRDLQKQLYPAYISKKPAGPYPTAQAQAWLQQNESALKLLRQGLKQKYYEPPQRTIAPGIAHYAGFREMARVLGTESDTRGQQGNWKGAAESALDTMRLGHQIPRGAPLIGALVGYAVQAMGNRQLRDKLPHLDAPTCRAAAREIEKLRATRHPFSEVIQEEKWLTLSNYIALCQTPAAIGLQLVGYNATTKKSTFRPRSRKRLISDLTNYMDTVSAAAKQPYATATYPTPPSDFLTGQTANVFSRARFNDAKVDTFACQLMLGLALRAYKLEKGTYPENLAQLTPNYLSKVPADGFGGGETLRYKKTGDKYLLWSIGPDKKDDGGKAIVNLKKTSQNGRFLVLNESTGDIVFGVNR